MKDILYFILLFFPVITYSQVEDVPISNSVYNFLMRAEVKGLLPHFSMTKLPLQRGEIKNALKQIRDNEDKLTNAEKKALLRYEKEFRIAYEPRAVVFLSKSDSIHVNFQNILTNADKMFYHYVDSLNKVCVRPYGSIDLIEQINSDNSQHSLVGLFGLTFYGTLSQSLGFYFQAKNGKVISGNKALATYNPEYKRSIKFTELNSDIDLTQSHIIFQKDWFRAKIGREEEQIGAGLFQKVYVTNLGPPQDEISFAAAFQSFRYDFSLSDLIGYSQNPFVTSVRSSIPSKYFVQHRFSIRPAWGEFGFWESVISSDRGIDIAYLNPIIFLKSAEHSLHDRDNSFMGFDATLRPLKNIELRSTLLLDDYNFSEIGKGYWSNKIAYNIAAIYSLPFNLDIGAEYARVEPYTFSHFNYQNSYTNDSILIGSILQPNSEQYSILFQYWWGNRYPLQLSINYTRHGANVYDSTGKLIKNVGGDPNITRRDPDPAIGFPGDPYYGVKFLDGNLQETLSLKVNFTMEIIRNLNISAVYNLQVQKDNTNHYFRIYLFLN
ncbi:MAG TPA: hypothetical protein PKV40_05890 [Candidatus Kapabacteria bacterium]|nr:hypothetical protein [Candidatus Kapabacteria bacterium]